MAYLQKYRTLGAVAAQDAANQVVDPAQYSGAKMTQQEMDVIVQSAQSGQIPFVPANFHANWGCTGQSDGSTAKLITTASGISVSIGGSVAAALAPAAIPIIGPVVAGVEALIGLFTAIFQHHAQAVAKEENVLCAAVPSVNQALQAIYDGVSSGVITAQQAIATLQQLQGEFANAVASIIKDDQTHCNAACVWTKCLAAIVIVKSSQYQDQINQQATVAAATAPTATQSAGAAPTGTTGSGNVVAMSTPNPTPASGLPSWALPVAAVVALYLVMS